MRLIKLTLLRSVLVWAISFTGVAPGYSWAEQLSSDNTNPAEVKVVQVADGYQLQRNGQPYQIKGAGMNVDEIAVFAAHGGNSIRTWSTGGDVATGRKFLDEAEKYGVTVALCLNLGRERHGFDYGDEEAVANQLEFARREVLKYKDHPALLFWIIGNELNHGYTDSRVFDAINAISKMIHAEDKYHPTTTALTGFSPELLADAESRAPDLDFLSFQLYASLDNLPLKIQETGYTKPFMITEWGATGHWEVSKTAWGAPIEMNSSEKAQRFRARYENVIAAHSNQIIGSYVFLFGQKQERTPTWYGMLLEDGSRTEAMDVMHYIWNGVWPEQRAPHVHKMLLDSKRADQSVVLHAGERYKAELDAIDPEEGELTYHWMVRRESEATEQGGDPEVIPEEVPVDIVPLDNGSIMFSAPEKAGAYRIFGHVYDGSDLAGHANIPFLVEPLPQ